MSEREYHPRQEEQGQKSLLYRLWSRFAAEAKGQAASPSPNGREDDLDSAAEASLHLEDGRQGEASKAPDRGEAAKSAAEPVPGPTACPPADAREEPPAALAAPIAPQPAAPVPEEPRPSAVAILPRGEEPGSPAGVEVSIAPDAMSATLLVSLTPAAPPPGLQELRDALAAQGVCAGIQEQVLASIPRYGMFGQPFVVALGRAPADGQNGRLEELYPRLPRPEAIGLGEVQPPPAYVEKGAVICKIRQPVPPVDGFTVRGERLPGQFGAPLALPQGENLLLSSEKDALIAGCSGYLYYEDDRFQIARSLCISQEVGAAAGRIELECSLVLEGDVGLGASVRVKGDLTVRGTVHGGLLEAGGNLYAENVAGGRLVAHRDFVGKVIENASVQADGDILAEQVSNAQLVSCQSVRLQGEGTLVGGSCVALLSVEAVTVGSAANTPTIISLGTPPPLSEQRGVIKRDMEDIQHEQEMLERDLKFLERGSRLTGEQQLLLSQKKKQRIANMVRLSRLRQSYQSIGSRLEQGRRDCQFTCQLAYPGTQIVMGRYSTTLRQIERFCLYKVLGGKIVKE